MERNVIWVALPFWQNSPVYPLMHWHWPSMHRPRPEQSAISHSSWRRLHSLPFQPGWHWHSPFLYSPWPPQSIGQAPKRRRTKFLLESLLGLLGWAAHWRIEFLSNWTFFKIQVLLGSAKRTRAHARGFYPISPFFGVFSDRSPFQLQFEPRWFKNIQKSRIFSNKLFFPSKFFSSI